MSNLMALGDQELKTALVGSAMSRARKAGIRRNLAVAAGNTPGTSARAGRGTAASSTP
ncbi:MAG: hypothetical protein QM736_01265 [Vicinamibacterales bacterium]